jgi:cystathionine gamma-synthase
VLPPCRPTPRHVAALCHAEISSQGRIGASALLLIYICNPTRKLLENEVYQLETAGMSVDTECTGSSTAYASGMAAVSSILMAYPKSHLILPDDCYHGVPSQLVTVLNKHGILHTPVDMTKMDAVEQLVLKESQNSNNEVVIVWMETPSNPLAKVTDIQAICSRMKKLKGKGDAKLVTVVDSTWAPPNITQPLTLGADAVMHSATKYFGGHSDLTMGLVTTSPMTENGRRLGQTLLDVQTTIGAVASPFDSWLCLRGMRTLSVRLQRQCQTAIELAIFLSGHSLVAKAHYPGLIAHPQHEVAKRQMKGGMYGGMLSFEVEDESTAMAVAGALNVIKRATSLGGTETLIEHRASIEPVGRVTSPPGLLRVSVGLEDLQDLRHDLDTALNIASNVMGR